MKVILIGFGTMGQAIAKALNRNKKQFRLSVTDRIFDYARSQSKLLGFVWDKDFLGLPTADMVIIAVKPQDIPSLAEEIKGLLKKDTILLSIAAGVDISRLQKLFRHEKVVRVMPNLGLAVGQGIAAWKAAGDLSSQDKKRAAALLNAISDNFEVARENLIDAVTAISGSGPAYFFYLAAFMIKAALGLRLGKDESKRLVQKTMLAAAFLQEKGDYEDLIKKVASKKGTTEAALKVFQSKRMGNIITSAVRAAAKRAKELGRG